MFDITNNTGIVDYTKAYDLNDMNAKVEYQLHGSDFPDGVLGCIYQLSQFLMKQERVFVLRPEVGGVFSGWSVYVKKPLRVEGWTPALPNMDIWTKVDRDNIQQFRDLVKKWYRQTLQDIGSDEDNAAYVKVVVKFYKELTEGTLSPSNTTLAIAMREVASGELNKDNFYTRNTSPERVTSKVMPQKWMFEGQFDGLDPYKLLKAFPEAEAHFFILAIGRALYGRDNTSFFNNEGELKSHGKNWRGWALLHSADGGIGKTTLMTALLDGMQRFGYTVAGINPDGKFNWYSTATADVAYKDDFNYVQQKKFIHHETVKVIATSGKISTEEKGLQRVDNVQCEAIMLGCTNTNDASLFYGADDGVVSRSNILSVIPEIYRDGVDFNIPKLWCSLAAKYGCKPQIREGGDYPDIPEALVNWFLAQCVEIYKNASVGVRELKSTRESFITEPGVSYVKRFARWMQTLKAIAVVRKCRMDDITDLEAIKALCGRSITPQMVIGAIAAASYLKTNHPDYPQGIDESIPHKVKIALNDKLQACQGTNESAIKYALHELRTETGVKYPDYLSAYMAYIDAFAIHTEVQKYMTQGLPDYAKEVSTVRVFDII